ncbi:MAG: hypothetical protein SVV80_02960 [Planctomycetota bacterium]|nr:hypothetical protein [Planctomycetota bacterium]
MSLSYGFLALLSPVTPACGQTGKVPDGLHVPNNQQRSFNIQLNDGTGQQWYFQGYLNVYRGINYVYNGGLYCQVSGANVQSNNMAWMNASGDEIEIGPYTRNNCRIYRRARVYKDRGLARWLDIFVNTTSSRQTVPVRIYTNLNRQVSRVITSSGASSFGKKDWAFITEHQGQPSLLHIVCGNRSKLRPSVSAGGRAISVNYSLVVPPGGIAVLCYFEAQASGTAELQKTLSQFNAGQLLNDLPRDVRRLIVNFRSGGGIADITLDRSGTADVVILKNDDAISGKITNKEYVIEPFFGELTLPAEEVIGFAAAAGNESNVHAVIAGGQVITGKLKDAVIKLDIPTGGSLAIPLSRIKQCSYRISREKPEESAAGPLILLRTGDRLAFDPADLKCTFQTRHGSITLDGKDLRKISLNHEAGGVHHAEFINDSTLAGILGPEKIALPLKLGPKLDVSRDMVLAVRFVENGETDSTSTSVMLNNEDELFGQLVDEVFEVATDFGTISVRPENITEMSFSDKDPGLAIIKMWDGSTLRGKIRQEALCFAVQPGPELNLHVGHIVAIRRKDALPPEATVKLVEKYVAMLSAANYKDREEAQEALTGMGRTIAPLLTGHLKDPDPEVRQRIRNVLEKLGVKVPE